MHPVFKTPFVSATSWAAALLLLSSCGGGKSNYDAPQVTMTVTNGAGVSGSIVITLASLQAPATAANFLAYVNSGFYNGTVFHRNYQRLYLQGGGYVGPLAAGALPVPRPKVADQPPIALEDGAGLSNTKFTVAMDRSPFGGATSQFVINLGDNLFRDRTTTVPGYAVFGTVTSGAEVLNAMATAACTASPGLLTAIVGDCLPTPNITITEATQTR
jgi:cyclophilin family peptidyl-prolyl cis-trans isomerase